MDLFNVHTTQQPITVPTQDIFCHKKNLHFRTEVAHLFRDQLAFADREHFMALWLDDKHRPLAMQVAHVGALSNCIVSQREILKAGVLLDAAFLYIGHNHPSGHSKASPEDINFTESIRHGASLLNMKLLDHFVIADTEYTSISTLQTFPLPLIDTKSYLERSLNICLPLKEPVP